MNKKNILVLARRDHEEAMRVAAGLTIFGHGVRLIFMSHPVSEELASSDQAELLELADIEPETTVAAMEGMLPVLNEHQLAEAISASDGMVNI